MAVVKATDFDIKAHEPRSEQLFQLQVLVCGMRARGVFFCLLFLVLFVCSLLLSVALACFAGSSAGCRASVVLAALSAPRSQLSLLFSAPFRSLSFLATMSIAQRLAAEAEKRDVDVDLAMKLLDYFKAKSQARGHIEVPDVRDPAHPVHNQANTCWCVVLLRSCLCFFFFFV